MNSGAEDKPRRDLGRESRPVKQRPRDVREPNQPRTQRYQQKVESESAAGEGTCGGKGQENECVYEMS